MSKPKQKKSGTCISMVRLRSRVRFANGLEGTIQRVHFGAVEVDCNGYIVTVAQDAMGRLPFEEVKR